MIGGLIHKDFLLLAHRKNALILILGLSIMLNMTSGDGFIIGYMTLLGAIFSISTLNYDEFDNGYAFLMTLPVRRKEYVKEKYIFCLGFSFGCWALAMAVNSIMRVAVWHTGIMGLEDTVGFMAMLPIRAIALGVMLPVQLKYGQEKSRIALAIIAGGVTLFALTASKVAPVADALENAEGLSPMTVSAVFLAIGCLVTLISYKLSVAIWENKEF